MKKSKGFTLIELIVVIVIVGILVGLSVGLYKGYTKEANLSKHMSYVKELESASERYYMDTGDWPRGSDESYTKEKIEEFSTKIKDITGKEIELDLEGSYYEIDYAKLGKYTKIPEDKGNYILQNPVGQIYYLEKLTQLGETRLHNKIEEPEKPEEPIPTKQVTFVGLPSVVFDNNLGTYTTLSGEVTWEGNLDNREIQITGKGSYSMYRYYQVYVEFRDINNNILIPVGETSGVVVVAPITEKVTKTIIVPKGAVKMGITNGSALYEITVVNEAELPTKVTNLTSTSTNSKITINWDQKDTNYAKAAIYVDGVFSKYVVGKTVTVGPFYSDTEHKFKIIAVNNYGNASQPVEYTVRTNRPEIVFRGLVPEAFDNNLETYTNLSGDVTWEGNINNKKIQITGKGSYSMYRYYQVYVEFRDINNNILIPVGETSGIVMVAPITEKVTKTIIVPEGAIKMTVTNGSALYDIVVID